MPATIERQAVAPHSDEATTSELSKAFLVPLGSRSYSKQYAQLYDYRLAYLKKRILPEQSQDGSTTLTHSPNRSLSLCRSSTPRMLGRLMAPQG